MKILCVAEKPSIAKEVSSILSGGSYSTRNSNNKYVKYFDFQFNVPNYGMCDITMTSVLGHVTNFEFGAEYSWNRCPPGRLFTAPISTLVSQQEVHKNLSLEGRNASKLMIWTDCDREGEYIGFEILEAAKKFNSSLTVENSWRAQFSHLERNHILNAMRNPTTLDMKSVNAVECRMEIDLRCGISFTRYLTDLFKAEGLVDPKDVISYGTCQFPTLGFIVDRYNRVKNFVPEPFWYIIVDVKKNGEKVAFQWTKNHFFDRLYTTLLYQKCLQHPCGQIIKLVKKPTSNWRPLPLTTVELQKDCSKFFRMSAKKALDVAEKLYNKGWISYPRTETDRFPAAMDLKIIIDKQKQSSKWGLYCEKLLNLEFRTPRAGNHDDKAHPPIHPVNFVDLSRLTSDEKTVYEYVVRRFLACCSDDARGEQTTITLKWGDELFTTNGLMVIAKNYLEIYTYHKWESSKKLPSFEEGEAVNITNGKLKEGKTTGPQHMTEPELIALMDLNGIGTDATMADHIEKIFNRKYVTQASQGSKDFIVPTVLGMGLIQGFDEIKFDNNISLSKPFIRKHLEISLQDIVDGKKNKQDIVDEMVMLYKNAFFKCNLNSRNIINKYQQIKSSFLN